MPQRNSPEPEPGDPGGPMAVVAWPDADTVPWDPPSGCRYRGLLKEVIDPELGVNIVDLGLVYDVRVIDGVARVEMTLTTPGCPLGSYFEDTIAECLWGAPGVNEVDVQIVFDPPWRPELMSDAAKSQLGWRR